MNRQELNMWFLQIDWSTSEVKKEIIVNNNNRIDMYFNEDTIEHFKQEAQIYDKTTVIELVERFVHVDITLEDGETEEMYIKQLLKEIYG